VTAVIVADEAEADLLSAFSFYEERRGALASASVTTSTSQSVESNSHRVATRSSIVTFVGVWLSAFLTPSSIGSTLGLCS
jgi:hypothetical protein